MDQQPTQTGVSRRDLLKRGAALGGAIVWMTPVVQTVGMSPALAQTVSEGNCCLAIEILGLEVFAKDSVLNDIRVSYSGTNCGTNQIFQVTFLLQYRKVGDADWEFAASSTGGNPGSGESTGVAQQEILNLVNGNYEFRLSATKACVVAGEALPHNTPLPYATAGPVTISVA